MMRRWPRLLVALPVAGTLLLAGCSSSEPSRPEAAPSTTSPEVVDGGSPAAPEVPADEQPVQYVPGENPVVGTMPESAPAPVAAEVGDVLPAAPAALPDGLHPFPLGDGTYLVVDPDEPLPERVEEEVSDRAETTLPIVTRPGDHRAEQENHRALDEYSTWVESSTGKRVVVVKPGPPAQRADGGAPLPVWTAWLRDPVTGASTSFTDLSPEAARSAAEDWIRKANGDPSTYLFVSF